MYIKQNPSLDDIEYETCIFNDKHWEYSEYIIPAKCQHCMTIYNFIDFSDGICPFCDR